MDKPTVHPIETTLSIPGVHRPVTILHITDLHACGLTEEEALTMPALRHRYAVSRRAAFSGGRPYPPEAVLPTLMDYAVESGADLVIMTGDMFDFPSEYNLSLLRDCMDKSPIPCHFIPGNHDWCFADDYRTRTAAEAYLPRMDVLCGGNHRYCLQETEDIVLFLADNDLEWVSEDVADAYMEAARYAKAVDKPLILAMHIPVRTDTLAVDCRRLWGRDICLGRDAVGAWDAHTLRFVREVSELRDFAPAVVITGHLHIDHEDTLPNGVTQIVTDIASGGHCRLIRLIPAD